MLRFLFHAVDCASQYGCDMSGEAKAVAQVSSHNVLQHRTLATGLGAYDGDLRQINRVLHLQRAGLACVRHGLGTFLFLATYADCGEDILELVDERDETRIIHVDPAACQYLSFVVNTFVVYPRLTRWDSSAP